MKPVLRSFLPHLIVFVAVFYLLPLPSVFDAHTTDTGLLMYSLLIIFPAVCFVVHIVFSLKHGFLWYLPLITGAVFAPTVFLYYNSTAIVYIFSYIVLSYIGAAAGYSVFRNHKDDPS